MARMVLGLGFALLIMICVGRNPVSGDLELLHLTISKNGMEDTNNVGVCFTVGDLTDYEYFQLDILESLEHGIFYKPITLAIPADLVNDPKCIYNFEPGSLSAEETSKLKGEQVGWALHVEETGSFEDSKPRYEVDIAITMPADLPLDAPPAGIYIIGDASPQIIKLPSAIANGKLFLNDVESTNTCTGYPCYYNTIPLITTVAEFMICDDSSNVPVCGNPTNGTLMTKDDTTVTSVSVDYTSGATLATFTTLGTFTGVINIDKMVGYDTLVDVAMTDNFEAYLVDYTEGSEKFQLYSVKDRKLEAYQIADATGVLEVKWSTLDDTDKYYKMSRTTNTDDSHMHDANVDCTSVEGDFCHAYFVQLDNAVHGIQIQKLKAWIADPKPEDDTWIAQGETTGVRNIAEDFRMIHIESVVSAVSGSIIELDICFKHITNTTDDDTRYEFLAVNSKGKWKKEMANKKKDDSHACFHELELPLEDFSKSSKFFVILRDSNSGKPLVSAEVTFDFPAPRAIKPEVDNGSNGSTSTLAIVGAAIAGIACLMALVAAAVMFVMKINKDNDGLQYPLHRNNIEDSSIIHGLENPIPTM